ncbi:MULTISPECIES: hypothetical protein [Bacillus cereus group]|uniref:hypothetical protein n=1 Tax=Bacillus cereus group TaxID=86661 RepID=UPI000B44F72F|nr:MULTISPECIES: hypothetical protein [Bacillus cereus group]OTX31257.1 hypothetical protein BK717_21880 [Bacillus thuringiensis serovar malayensis]OUB11649.1 hypothetical protein BK709_02065 [Bacillus thuringiensis serovar shandongiensis]MBX0354319.1 hypothetical protein [Bacillus toyonensis]MDM5256570.1 hypothetical protein [Bacillus toyonensis]MEC2390869.1 hypothetical protein [Bacillus toyonensis]
MKILLDASWMVLVTFLAIGFFSAVYYYFGLNESYKKKLKKREVVDLFVSVVVFAGATFSLIVTVLQAKYVILVYLSLLAVCVALHNVVKKCLDLKDKE